MSLSPKQLAESYFSITLPTKALATIADGDYIVASLPLPCRCEIVSMHSIAVVAASTASKATTLTAQRTRGGTEASTGVALALTTSNQNSEGEIVSSTSTATFAQREYLANDLFSVKASATTTFGEGESSVVAYFKRLAY